MKLYFSVGSLPIQDHIKQQGSSLLWLLERCRNRYHVMTNHSSSSHAEIKRLFETIKEMAVTKYPREIQDSKVRPHVSMWEQQRWHTAREEDVSDEHPRQRQLIASGWPYTPRGRSLYFLFHHPSAAAQINFVSSVHDE